jgi:chromosome segregation ATPase
VGSGAFRDGAAALERAARLAEENERLTSENASLRADLSANNAGARALRERDDLRAQIEDLRVSHIAAVKRLREEAVEQRRRLEERIAQLGGSPIDERETVADLEQALRDCRDVRAQLERRLANAPTPESMREREQQAEAAIKALESERRTLAARVSELETKLEGNEAVRESNEAAVRRRLMDERDDLDRQVRELRDELARAKARRAGGLLRLLLGRRS